MSASDYSVLMIEACSNISFGSKCLWYIKTVHNLGREREEEEEMAEIPLYFSRTWLQCCVSSVYVLSLMIILFFKSASPEALKGHLRPKLNKTTHVRLLVKLVLKSFNHT